MVLVVADIFGYTAALARIADRLGDKTVIVDPYQGRDMQFANEAQAYEYFSQNVGLQAYTAICEQAVTQAGSHCRIIGFSMGASAIWCLSANSDYAHVNAALGFYGSQIRYHTDITPQFPFKLIFPASEQHFSVTELIDRLKHNSQIEIEQSHYLHGFMNSYSEHFNQQGYDKYMIEIQQFAEASL